MVKDFKNKKVKGATLVEVIVSMAVFLIVFGVLVASFFSLRTMVKKQQEYLHFEAICSDIAIYRDNKDKVLGDRWELLLEAYFGPHSDKTIYFGSNYDVVETKNEATYTLTYSVNDVNNTPDNFLDNQLVISVHKTKDFSYMIVENLNLGTLEGC